MKQHMIILTLGILCLFFMAVSPAFAGDHTQLYEKYLSDKISNYLNLSEMLLHSKNPRLRRDAAVYLQKASCYFIAKQDIIRELNAKEGCLKPHQIHCYLNKKFDHASRENLRNLKLIAAAD